jgi:hypothetical protein
MKKLAIFLLCIMLQPIWATGQEKGFVGGKSGEALDDLMIDFSKKVIRVRCWSLKTAKSFCTKVTV